ncbi:hypothetical protein [Dysgonomonas sp. ZJ709]|uniref:hypothetical protein n=1 Tax=Dysgonomonas sp. ZJ709 TaxID=2709797 RepID=UPI0013E99E8E|nr:hypothetical protein [Dysgonomonas sp. ZJ709]
MERVCLKKIFIFSFAVILSLIFVQCSNANKVQHELEKYVERENKNYPKIIDDFTRLEGCEALPSNTLRYNYTIQVESAMLDTVVLKKALKEKLIHSIKTEPGSAFLRNNNVTFQYQYNDAANSPVFRIDIPSEDYK